MDVAGGTTPTNWSSIGGDGTATNAIDETGAATAVDIAFDLAPNSIPQGINAGTLPTHTQSLSELDNFDAFAVSVDFSDLMPNAQYELWIFSVYDLISGGSTFFDATVTGSGAPTVRSFSLTVIGDLVINGVSGSSLNSLDSYAITVAASNTGTIDIAFGNATGDGEIPLAGVAIRKIPEPTTALLLACGLLALGVRRRLH